ncbi:MAG: hypothetical protein V1748_12785 [Actinomycetota bacterium]
MAISTALPGTAALIEWSSPWTYLLFGVFFLMVIMGTWTGAVAAGRGRSMQWWFIIGFFVPIIGLIVLYILKPLPMKDESKS